MMRVGVLGAGSWGTALAIHAASAGASVKLWARRQELAEQLVGERCNSTYLPGVEFPDNLTPTADVSALAGSEIVFVVVPSHGYREVTRLFLQQTMGEDAQIMISATKGIETESLARMSQVTEEEAAAANRSIRLQCSRDRPLPPSWPPAARVRRCSHRATKNWRLGWSSSCRQASSGSTPRPM